MNRGEVFQKLAALTLSKCRQCPVPKTEAQHRCCDVLFCKATWSHMPESVRLNYAPDWTAAIPFMGKNGCVVEPKDRPFCTAYVCPQWLTNRTFRREYEALCEKASVPAVQREYAL